VFLFLIKAKIHIWLKTICHFIDATKII
jgi:hypothetical protein